MKKKRNKLIFRCCGPVLAAGLILTGCGGSRTDITGERNSVPESVADSETTAQWEETARWLIEQNPSPQFGSVGGEWLMLGLARSDMELPEDYAEDYYDNVCTYVTSVNGILDERKYTEYSRTILALTALGRNPANVEGYNLLEPLADFDQTTFQGINGAVYALLALDAGNYEIPEAAEGTTGATRDLYLETILNQELPEGGWSLSGNEAEVDITAMTLQCLAKYKDQETVAAAIDRGLAVLSELQNEEGGFEAGDEESSESICQVLTALAELGISTEDERFVKNGHTPEERLRAFSCGDGSFSHLIGGDADEMATEQALYAMVAVNRMEEGKAPLYVMYGQ